MSKTKSYVWIVASVQLLTNAIRSLYILGKDAVPEPPFSHDQGISLMIEQQEHRNILSIGAKFLRGLDPSSALHESCRQWLAQYEARVREAFPHLGPIPRDVTSHFGKELAVRPQVLAASRDGLLLSVFDLIRLVTQIHPSGSHNAPAA
jgi:hypothetical protein